MAKTVFFASFSKKVAASGLDAAYTKEGLMAWGCNRASSQDKLLPAGRNKFPARRYVFVFSYH